MGVQTLPYITAHLLIVLHQQYGVFLLQTENLGSGGRRDDIHDHPIRSLPVYLLFGVHTAVYGKKHMEGGTTPRIILHPDGAMMQPDDGLCQTQSDTGARHILRLPVLDLIERGEDVLHLLLGNTLARVAYEKMNQLRILRQTFQFFPLSGRDIFQLQFGNRQNYFASRLRVFERVGKQVEHNLLEQGLVKPGNNAHLTTLIPKADLLAGGYLVERAVNLHDKGTDIVFGYLQLHLSCLILAQVHQLVHQQQQTL